MADTAAASSAERRRFQSQIYRDLDRKLKNSRWNGGASEAHGLLCALACRGVGDGDLREHARLFRFSAQTDIELLDGMFGLILRDLKSDEFAFTLLLPDDDEDGDANTVRARRTLRVEAVADWCGGFMQGFLHDGDAQRNTAPAVVREAVDDILAVSRLESPTNRDSDDHASAKQLVEVEEYLRVAAQTIFEELNQSRGHAEAGNAIN